MRLEPAADGWFCADDYRFSPSFASFPTPNRTASCLVEPSHAIFSRACGSARDAPGLCDGSIWPKTGCASIV
jgi:hypothetical protein